MTQPKKLSLAVVSILFSLSPAVHAATGFQTAQSYPVGTNPRALIAARMWTTEPLVTSLVVCVQQANVASWRALERAS